MIITLTIQIKISTVRPPERNNIMTTASLRTHAHTHTHTHAHTHARTHTRTHARTHSHAYTRTFTSTNTCMYTITHKRFFFFLSCKTLRFLRDSGSEFQTAGPKTEKDLYSKVSREKRGTVNREVSRERNVLEGQYG